MKANTHTAAFHIGRGGRFNNPGYKSYNPYVHELSDLFGDACLHNIDEDGNILPGEEWLLLDSGSNVILEGREDIESITGTLEWDGIYDSDIVKYVEDCDADELQLMYDEYEKGGYLDYEIVEYICTELGMHRIDDIKFYKTNAEIFCHDCTLTFFWDEEFDVTEEDAREWLIEHNIDSVSIDRYASSFEAHFYHG